MHVSTWYCSPCRGFDLWGRWCRSRTRRDLSSGEMQKTWGILGGIRFLLSTWKGSGSVFQDPDKADADGKYQEQSRDSEDIWFVPSGSCAAFELISLHGDH